MDQYQARLDELEREISRLRHLRDAQAAESRQWDHFQNTITALTDELLAWEQAGPELDQLDDAIEHAERRVTRAEREARDAAGTWTAAAGFTGTVGVVLGLISLAWTLPWWLPALSVILLVIAAAALMAATRARRTAQLALNEADRHLAELNQRRDSLLPSRP